MKKNKFINVECEDDPGLIKKYYVKSTKPEGWVQLLYQTEYRNVPYTKEQLLACMKENGITQQQLSEVIGRARSTTNRYLTGKLPIPKWVFERIGVKARRTELQTEAKIEEIVKELAEVRGILDKFINNYSKGNV